MTRVSTSLLDSVQSFVHTASVGVIGIVVIIIAVGLVRPALLKRLFHEFTERKYIAVVGVFACLLSGTIFVATEPMQKSPYVSESNKHTIESVNPLDTQTNQEEESIRVEEVTSVKPIAFAKTQIEDPSLAKGQTKLTQAGVNGQKTSVFSVTYDDNIEVSRSLKSEQVTLQPVAEITAIGTLVAQEATPAPAPQHSPQPAAPTEPTQRSSGIDSMCKNSRSWICSWLR